MLIPSIANYITSSMNKFILLILLSALLPSFSQTPDNSIRVIGYATVPIQSGAYNLICNPFSSGKTNGANEIGLNIDGIQIITWENSNYNYYSFQSAFNSWVNENFIKIPPPTLPPGKGFFLFIPNNSITNLIFSGDVVPMPGATLVFPLQYGYSLVGSPLPYNSTNITDFPINLPYPNSIQLLYFYNNLFHLLSYEQQFGGWINDNFISSPPPPYSVGQAFFFYNPYNYPLLWIQNLP